MKYLIQHSTRTLRRQRTQKKLTRSICMRHAAHITETVAFVSVFTVCAYLEESAAQFSNRFAEDRLLLQLLGYRDQS